MKKIILPLLALALFTSCHKESEVEKKADEFSKAIIEDFTIGNTKKAEADATALNNYAHTLSDKDLAIFMARYETYAEEISRAASQNIKNAMEQAADKMNSDSAAVLDVKIDSSNVGQ